MEWVCCETVALGQEKKSDDRAKARWGAISFGVQAYIVRLQIRCMTVALPRKRKDRKDAPRTSS